MTKKTLEVLSKRDKLEKTAHQIAEEFEGLKGNGFRGRNLCAPCNFPDKETAILFEEIISSGKYPLRIAEGRINPIFNYVGEDRKNVIVGYSVPVRYIRLQKSNGGAWSVE